jgi:protein-S-isoprenylcysteine O-methyltransferase Ste14
MSIGPRLGALAYGALFTIILPLLLAVWAVRLDRLVALPRVGTPWGGASLAMAGALLMLAATIALRVRGGGWPMSPFPPQRRVTGGAYAVVSDPIYAGAVMLAAGCAIVLESPAGLWIVTPLLAAGCFAFVIGYEREATNAHFGPRPTRPLLRLPAARDAAPDIADRLSVYLLVFLPWYLAYEGVNRLLGNPDAPQLATRWDAAIPVLGWTEPAYFLAYPFLLAVPLVARTQQQLRRFTVQGWIAIVSVTTIYLVFPTYIDARPVPPDAPFAPLMAWERAFDDHAAGFPAFHVVWAVLAAALCARAIPRLRLLWWLLAAAITASCVTTGMHVIADVAAALVMAALILRAGALWRAIVRGAERIADSWREWDLGAVRFLSHGVHAAAGAFCGIVMIGALAGEAQILAAGLVAVAAIAGAGLWAQFVEGSPALLRPYGFYGGLLGGLVAIALVPLIGADPWLVFAAYAVVAPVVQAFGRLRCLVQGCCHGRAAEGDGIPGIRYTHPRSRVTRLSELGGTSLHPTQVYSIVWSLFTLALLARLWVAAASLSFIAGAFFVLNGLGRFVEEHYRGEPHTRILAGLRLYQWLALASVVFGAVLATIATPPAPPVAVPAASAWLGAAVVGAITYVAYGVDFPRWNVRFARLV